MPNRYVDEAQRPRISASTDIDTVIQRAQHMVTVRLRNGDRAAAAGMHLIGWLPDGVSDSEVAPRAWGLTLKIAPIPAYCNCAADLFLGDTAFDEK